MSEEYKHPIEVLKEVLSEEDKKENIIGFSDNQKQTNKINEGIKETQQKIEELEKDKIKLQDELQHWIIKNEHKGIEPLYFERSLIEETGEKKRPLLMVVEFNKGKYRYIPKWVDLNDMLFTLLNIEKDKFGDIYSSELQELIMRFNKFLSNNIKSIGSKNDIKYFIDNLEKIKWRTYEYYSPPPIDFNSKIIQLKYKDGTFIQFDERDYNWKDIGRLKKYKTGKYAKKFFDLMIKKQRKKMFKCWKY